MKDIPMFTTEYGIASLSLQQIPYRAEAYISIRQTSDLSRLLAECVRFCRMCGAQRIFATGHPDLQLLPLHTHVYRMRGVPCIAETACLWPVTAENASRWRQIYNEKMKTVDNASALSPAEEGRLYEESGAYFVHDGKDLLGIGWLRDDELLAVASVMPGAGKTVLGTILSLSGDGCVNLEVASTNLRAIALYEKMGFVITEISRSWYCAY